MKKIQFTIDNSTLIIGYKVESNTFKNINNTNIISKDDLIFDTKYFKNNVRLIAGFLNVMVKNENIKHAIVEQEELIITTLDLLNYMPTIEELVIKPNVPIDYDMHLAILKNDTLKVINCYHIPNYLLERIDTTKSVKIVTRAEVFFASSFLKANNLDSYSDVFYKKKITIAYDFTELDYKDFEQFLDINTYLRTIYFEYMNMDLIKSIMKCLRDHKKKNIAINIKGSKDNLVFFEALEDYAKKSKYMRKNKIRFKIDYTEEYKLENFVKLLNFTTLKYLLIGIIISCIFGYGINQYDIYKSSEEIGAISDNITDLLEQFETLEPPTTEPIDPDITTDPGGITEPTPTPNNNPTPPKKPAYSSAYYKDYPQVISVLKKTNPDTVGWLRVNNTTINYPVVQFSNNSYYLNHDFNKKSNSLGWIFLDYRNNATDLDKNTIIYGHNVSQSAKIMFGDLRSSLNANWYTKAENQYITFNTIKGEMEWRIFSVYTIAATNDYIYNTFATDDEFMAFVDKMKSRSIYDFGAEVLPTSKILTLSTCQSAGKKRLVVQAVLVEK